MRAFALVLMLTLVVSFVAPSSAAAKTESDQPCCCATNCHCPVPCTPACREAQAPVPDKQSPVRPAEAPVVRLFAVSDAFPAATTSFFLPAIFDRCELNASPPLGGNPQQAVLRLWRI